MNNLELFQGLAGCEVFLSKGLCSIFVFADEMDYGSDQSVGHSRADIQLEDEFIIPAGGCDEVAQEIARAVGGQGGKQVGVEINTKCFFRIQNPAGLVKIAVAAHIHAVKVRKVRDYRQERIDLSIEMKTKFQVQGSGPFGPDQIVRHDLAAVNFRTDHADAAIAQAHRDGPAGQSAKILMNPDRCFPQDV